jgi:hypothetical protein
MEHVVIAIGIMGYGMTGSFLILAIDDFNEGFVDRMAKDTGITQQSMTYGLIVFWPLLLARTFIRSLPTLLRTVLAILGVDLSRKAKKSKEQRLADLQTEIENLLKDISKDK